MKTKLSIKAIMVVLYSISTVSADIVYLKEDNKDVQFFYKGKTQFKGAINRFSESKVGMKVYSGADKYKLETFFIKWVERIERADLSPKKTESEKTYDSKKIYDANGFYRKDLIKKKVGIEGWISKTFDTECKVELENQFRDGHEIGSMKIVFRAPHAINYDPDKMKDESTGELNPMQAIVVTIFEYTHKNVKGMVDKNFRISVGFKTPKGTFYKNKKNYYSIWSEISNINKLTDGTYRDFRRRAPAARGQTSEKL